MLSLLLGVDRFVNNYIACQAERKGGGMMRAYGGGPSVPTMYQASAVDTTRGASLKKASYTAFLGLDYLQVNCE